MKIRRILAVAAAAAMLAGCAGKAAPGAGVSPEGGNKPGQSAGTVHSVTAEYPEAITDMTAQEFEESDAYWEWRSAFGDKAGKSAEIQEGMEAYYAAVMQELLAADGEENTVCSPLNIYIALAMLAEVTDGNSRQQILEALRVDSIDQLRERVTALWDANYADVPSLKSVLANSLWMRDNMTYNEETLKRLSEMYYASAFSGPMGSEIMNQALQNWTDENTGGLLKDYTKDLQMSPETVLALVSTIYYKAAWIDSFPDALTQKETFHGAAGDTEADMMHARDTMQVSFGDNFTSVSKELKDSGCMHFFLPHEGVDVRDVIRNPQMTDLICGKWDGDGEYRTVNLAVPKFKVQAQTDLMEPLKHLGISDVMDAGLADFSPLTDEEREISLSSAEHAALVEIDEEGVTGAAYTILMLTEGAMLEEPEEYDFILDRPFCFAVTAQDGSILFGGVVQGV